MWTPPLLLNPVDGADVDRFVEREDESNRLPALRVTERGRAGVFDLGRPARDPRFDAGGVTFPAQELFGAGSREPTTVGNVVYYPDDDVPAGLYRADPANSQWVKVEDNSVTLPD